MGLDSVELLVEVEKAFNINIPDQEAEKIVTVGDFHDCVWKRLEGKYSDRCKSQALFYKLRESSMNTFQLPKQEVKLDSFVNDIFPDNDRRKAYYSFADANQLQFPVLALPKLWVIFLNTFGLITILGGLAWSLILINVYDQTRWTLLIPVVAIAIVFFISGLLDPKRTVIEQKTVRGFTEKVLSLNYAALAKERGVNRKEMELVINHIIVDKIGVEWHEVKPEARIVDDLGID